MIVYVILYTYDGWDGEIDRFVGYKDSGGYIAFSTKEKAQEYLDSHKDQFNNENNEYEIVPVEIV